MLTNTIPLATSKEEKKQQQQQHMNGTSSFFALQNSHIHFLEFRFESISNHAQVTYIGLPEKPILFYVESIFFF